MKVVILAGGFGTRLSEYTHAVPKPMVKIGNLPIVVHIIHHYLAHGFNDFIIATGYKAIILRHILKDLKKIIYHFSKF